MELKKYKQLLLENYSNKSVFNYKWLYQLLVFLSVIFCFSFFKQTYKLYGTNVEVLNTLRLVLALALVGFLVYIVLKSMYYPNLFRNINSRHLLVKGILKEGIDKKYSNENFQKELNKLLAFMEEEEPYLDASLTLQKLAEKVEIPSREVSILINLNLNQHFFDFVNQYRIRKAEKMLLNSEKENLTIQQVMYDVGFNSKSSFYTAFKKQTGATPSEYRKSKAIF
ncbi:MAG: helix-turn-helix transcriptional regulator [Flavobacteriaceae bacterium]